MSSKTVAFIPFVILSLAFWGFIDANADWR